MHTAIRIFSSKSSRINVWRPESALATWTRQGREETTYQQTGEKKRERKCRGREQNGLGRTEGE